MKIKYILCIMFKIISLFIITLYSRLYVYTTDKMLFNKVLISSVKRFERWSDFFKIIDLIVYYSEYGDVVNILNMSVHLQFTALITPLVSFSHCIVCPSSIYRLITPLVFFGHSLKMAKRYQRVIKAVNWRWTDNTIAKRYQRGNQKKMDKQRFSHCIVCPSSIYRLITPLVSFGHSIVCPSSIYRFDYPFGIFWPLYKRYQMGDQNGTLKMDRQ
jgi:cellulose synthase/poly-beta-1,6-N-acetylglucosamine synthase-like glycosyltransferase